MSFVSSAITLFFLWHPIARGCCVDVRHVMSSPCHSLHVHLMLHPLHSISLQSCLSHTSPLTSTPPSLFLSATHTLPPHGNRWRWTKFVELLATITGPPLLFALLHRPSFSSTMWCTLILWFHPMTMSLKCGYCTAWRCTAQLRQWKPQPALLAHSAPCTIVPTNRAVNG